MASVAYPFSWASVEPRGFIARLFRGADRDAARQDVINIFADTPPERVPIEAVMSRLREHGFQGKRARTILCDVFEHAVAHFLKDLKFDAHELEHLERLRVALDLTATEAAEVATRAARPLYAKALASAAADDVLSATDRERLRELATSLRLQPSAVDQVNDEVLVPMVKQRFDAMVADERVSPDEDKVLVALAQDLGVKLDINDATNERLNHYRRLWQIENGDIPEVGCDVNLQRHEKCHFAVGCRWAEMRTRTVRVNYSGPVVSIPIVKGVRYRIGSIRPTRVTEDSMETLDAGYLYITNKRVIFRGSRLNKTIRHASILGFDLYSDGIRLQKSTGRPPFVLFESDLEIAAAVLSRMLRDT